MARGPSKFTQRDVTRAMRAAFAAGAVTARVEIVGPDGSKLLIEGLKAAPAQDPTNEFDLWKAKHARSAEGHQPSH